MNRALGFLFLLSISFSAFAQIATDAEERFLCKKHDGTDCSQDELEDPVRYKQILFLPVGYTAEQEEEFNTDYNNFIFKFVSAGEKVYSQKYKENFLFIKYWLPGGAFEGEGKVNFDGRVPKHPIRDKFAITLNRKKVDSAVVLIKRYVLDELSPASVVTIFNTEKDATPNAKPPTFLDKKYGIVLVNKIDANESYATSHELGHGLLNFLDEYVENGMGSLNIRTADKGSFLATWGKGFEGIGRLWHHVRGTYRIKISEILAGNGSDNIDVSQFPSRVRTAGYVPNKYEYEGGMFFGRGTYHDKGKNIMNGGRVKRGEDDTLGFDHSLSQKGIVKQAFEKIRVAARPNDRIRNAGPVNKLRFTWRGKVKLMLYDGDKNHRWHPTKDYEVQIGYYKRKWKWCKAWIIPYPCHENKWTSFQKIIKPTKRFVKLKETKLYGVTKFVRFLTCNMGLGKLIAKKEEEAAVAKICTFGVDDLVESYIPTLQYLLPYQETHVPSRQWLTKYFWRFRTYNGTKRSGWTGWSKFTRVI